MHFLPGLQILLLMKPHVSLPNKDDASKYSLGISNSLSIIDQKLNVISIEAGMNTIVSVTPQLIETTEDFDALNPNTRKCRLPHETFEDLPYGLKSAKNYSRTACEHECAFMKAVSVCKCTPWYYKNNFTTVPICEMFGGYCFDKVMSTRKFYKQCADYCLDDCNGIQQTWEKSFRPINIEKICRKGSALHEYLMKSAKQHFSDDNYKRLTTGDKEKIAQQFVYLDKTMRNENISDHYETLCKQFADKYIAIITVEAPTDVITKISRDLETTFFELVGILGGELGLFTGFSMLSILEYLTAIYNFIWHYGEDTNTDDELETKRKRQEEQNIENVYDKRSHQQRLNWLARDVETLRKEITTLRKVCDEL